MDDASDPPDVDALVRQVHASATRVVLAITGGGSRAISRLLEVPGASRTVLEAVVPYSSAAWLQWVGGAPDQYCSEPAARALAMAAFERARLLAAVEDRGSNQDRAADEDPPVREDRAGTVAESDVPDLAGVGSTASLASDRPKRGPHRVHVALQTATRTQTWSVELVKGARTRRQEETVCSRLILAAVAAACGTGPPGDAGLLPTESIAQRQKTAPPAWTELLLGRHSAVLVQPAAGDPPGQLIFPGAFHPLHEGHRRMAAIAARRVGETLAFELSIRNVDKPPLDFLELAARLEGLGDQPVWITRAATFVEKAAIFPGATFVVGADTIARIGDPKYYGGSAERLDQAIDALERAGCRFLVFGRRMGGTFRGIERLDLPPRLRALCRQVPEREFRIDICSTDIRGSTETRHRPDR